MPNVSLRGSFVAPLVFGAGILWACSSSTGGDAPSTSSGAGGHPSPSASSSSGVEQDCTSMCAHLDCASQGSECECICYPGVDLYCGLPQVSGAPSCGFGQTSSSSSSSSSSSGGTGGGDAGGPTSSASSSTSSSSGATDCTSMCAPLDCSQFGANCACICDPGVDLYCGYPGVQGAPTCSPAGASSSSSSSSSSGGAGGAGAGADGG